MGRTNPAEQPTPDRKSHVRFDLNRGFTSENAFSYGRPARLMFAQSQAAHNALEFTVGWSLRAYHEDLSVLIERDEAGDLTADACTVPAGFTQKYFWKKPDTTEMPNALVGASAEIADFGYRMWRKAVTAGDDWDDANYVLTADQSAFPFTGVDNPYGIDNTIALDRVYVSSDNDTQDRDVFFSIFVYGSKLTESRNVARVMFTGPAGADKVGKGSGQYCLVINFGGACQLFEKQYGGSSWFFRYEFASPLVVASSGGNGRLVILRIYKSGTCYPPTAGQNGYIKFDFRIGQMGNALESLPHLMNKVMATGAAGARHLNRYHYSVPNRGDALANGTASPLRVDFRRDLLGSFNITHFKYPVTEDPLEFDDAPFSMPAPPIKTRDELDDPINNLTFSYTVCTPTGTVCYAQLHRLDTGAELAVVSTFANGKIYETPTGIRDYFVRWFVQTTDSAVKPMIFDYTVSRDAVLENPGIPTWEIGDASHAKSSLLRYSIRGPERDLSQSSAEIVIADPLNKCTELLTRSGMSVRIETEYDSSDTTKRLVLFNGIVSRADAQRKKPDKFGYPVKGWHVFDVRAKGIWQILEENFVDSPFYTLIKTDGTPYRAAEVIKTLISRAGFDPDTCFDTSFDTNPIPIIASNLDYTQNIDMLEKISQVVKSLARDYLSQILWFDDNAVAASGIWRLLDIPVSPYTNKASFTLEPPAGSSPKLTHYLPSYPTITDAESGLQIPVIPIDGETPVITNVVPPEANWLVVTSVGAWHGDGSGVVYSAFKFNPDSFNFGGVETADPTSPEYLGRRVPLWVIDPALGSAGGPDAVVSLRAATNALADRIARLTFKAVKTLTFRAPIVAIDHEFWVEPEGDDDTNVVFEKRTLRHMDPVLVDGTQWLIRNVNPDFVKDGVQYGMYELEAPRAGE